MAIYAIAIPIIEQLVDLICSAIAVLQLKISKKAAILQNEIESITPSEGGDCAPIGFMLPTEEDFDNEE